MRVQFGVDEIDKNQNVIIIIIATDSIGHSPCSGPNNTKSWSDVQKNKSSSTFIFIGDWNYINPWVWLTSWSSEKLKTKMIHKSVELHLWVTTAKIDRELNEKFSREPLQAFSNPTLDKLGLGLNRIVTFCCQSTISVKTSSTVVG